ARRPRSAAWRGQVSGAHQVRNVVLEHAHAGHRRDAERLCVILTGRSPVADVDSERRLSTGGAYEPHRGVCAFGGGDVALTVLGERDRFALSVEWRGCGAWTRLEHLGD